ncbi:hypothetical protein ACH0C8_15840, partial [Acetobacter lovaniensis]|uniref:hypothetical protein n=1 Tax=Acetobacter lovaniensis TaxID=104100 RepID=UPI0037704BFC
VSDIDQMKSFLCYTITFPMAITILATMFTTTAQARDFQRSTLPLANERSVHFQKNPPQRAVKDFAYRPPIVGLLADIPSRV